MDEEQFVAWQEYGQAEPFGEDRADLRSGIVASVIANVNRDPKKGRPYRPDDFMPKYGEATKQGGRGERKPLMAEDWRRAKKTAGSIWGGRRASD